MSRPSPILWIALLFLLLLPSTAGRLLLDLAGGLVLFLLVLPFILGGLGWLGWRLLQSRLVTCEVCGLTILPSSLQCPACGYELKTKRPDDDLTSSIPASEITIDVSAEDAD